MVKNTDPTSSPSGRDDSKFKGVRKRKWGKYVSEIRLPNSRQRIWLGSYDSAVKAARAFDAALFCLRGRNAKFNFPDTPPDIAGGRILSPAEIQAAAYRFANSAASSASTSLSDSVLSHSESNLLGSPTPSEGTVCDVSLDPLDDSFWDLNHYNNNYGYTNMEEGQHSGSGYYPIEYGIHPTDFYTPAVDHIQEDSYDSCLSQTSFLWNF